MLDHGGMIAAITWLCCMSSGNVSVVQLGRWQLLAGGRPSTLPGTLSQAPQLLQGEAEGVLGLLVGCCYFAPSPLHRITCHVHPNLHKGKLLILLDKPFLQALCLLFYKLFSLLVAGQHVDFTWPLWFFRYVCVPQM